MNVQPTELVASVQFEPKLLRVEENLACAQQMTFEATSKGAKLVVLPELCISGFSLKNKQEASMCAQQRDGYQTQALLEISQMSGAWIVFGYVELREGKLYNSAALLSPRGYVGGTQKHNLYGYDNVWAERSTITPPVYTTPVGRLGMLICRDLVNNYSDSYRFYKPSERFYRKGSVDTIALLTNWGTSYGYPDASWVELAEGLDANVIVSNRVGVEEETTWMGGSAVIDRKKRIWTNGSSFTEPAVVGGVVLL